MPEQPSRPRSHRPRGPARPRLRRLPPTERAGGNATHPHRHCDVARERRRSAEGDRRRLRRLRDQAIRLSRAARANSVARPSETLHRRARIGGGGHARAWRDDRGARSLDARPLSAALHVRDAARASSLAGRGRGERAQPRRVPARHRQDRLARRRPAQGRGARRGRVAADAPSSGRRRQPLRGAALSAARAADRPPSP